MPRRTKELEAAGRALAGALEDVHERDRLRSRIAAALDELHVHMRTAAELRAALRRDAARAAALEKPGVRRLVATLSGRRESRLSATRAGLAEAKRRLDATRTLADADQAEVRALRRRVDSMAGVDSALWRAFEAKEEALADASPRAREALRRVAAGIGAAQSQVRAANDVSEIARRAKSAVAKAREEIDGARASGHRPLAAEAHMTTAHAFARQADACLARLTRAMNGVAGMPSWGPPRYARADVRTTTARLEVWLPNLIGRIRKRRRALEEDIRRLEDRRTRWVLRA